MIGSVDAIDPHEAQETFDSEITLQLGAIGFLDRSAPLFSLSNGMRRPLLHLVKVPFITVHEPDGELAYNGYWYDEWYPKKHPKQYTDTQKKSMIDASKALFLALRRSSWADDAGKAMYLYSEAFGQHDPVDCLREGWRVLEFIGGSQNTKTDTKILRAANMFHERSEQLLVGRHLNYRRNFIVHGKPIDGGDKVVLAYQMRDFLWPLMRLFIMNPFNFESKEELWSFCDLPSDADTRERLRRALDLADRFFVGS